MKTAREKPETLRQGPIPGDNAISLLKFTGVLLILASLLAGLEALSELGTGRTEAVAVALISAVGLWATAALLFGLGEAVQLLKMVVANLRLLREPPEGEARSGE
jgi:hypothetical protein